ncbi:hypothetical protein FDECE_17088 [Fusarium decemcellulare]|nr:hypothetical protein FDECE_17088 [Fusarium decemcellulare]
MRPANYLPRPELLLSAFTSISIYGAIAMAQDTKDDNKDSAAAAPAATNTDDKKSDTANTDAAKNTDAKNTDASKPTATAAETAKETNDDKKSDEKTDEKTDDKAAATTEDKAASTTEEKDEPTSTEGDDPTSTEDVESKITSISSANDAVETGLPTLTKLKPIPTYPAATVPPTNNAPFMQHSSAPDGTIFIAVGAILGAFGIAILLWRLIVGILLHRSVERAAKAQHDANAKTGFPAPPAPFYKYTDGNSAMSLSAGRGVRRTTRGPVLSSTPSASNLFFSPTAAASGNGAGNRGSAFLPSGFYAAGTSSPGAGHDHSISLTNLRPDSRGHFGNHSRHTLDPSPPDSPSFQARRDISNSSINLNRPPSQRAPSAFLEDLLADDPSSLPPPHMPGSRGGRHSSYGSGSPGAQNRF